VFLHTPVPLPCVPPFHAAGLSNDDFFKDPLSAKGLGGRPGSGQFGGYGGMGAPAAGRGADAEPVAQKKFGNAKAISSRCVL
jgi:hypothetical protein